MTFSTPCFYSLAVNTLILAQTQMQKSVAARSLLFSPGGPLAKELSRHGVVLRVNDWLFAHGGILPHHGEGCYFMCASIFYCVWQTCLVSCVVTLESLGSLFLYCIELLFSCHREIKVTALCSGVRPRTDKQGSE